MNPTSPLSSETVPAREPGAPALLVVLHGLGDSATGWSWLPGELDLPWLRYRLVNAPDEYYGGRSWFGFTRPLVPGTASAPAVSDADVRRSREMLHAVLAEEVAGGTPAGRISVLGFSQGCLMALDAGLRHPEPLAGVVGISGWVHEPDRLAAEVPSGAREVPVLMTHGTWDEVVPIDPVRVQAGRLREAGFDVAWTEFEKEHTVAGRAELQLIRAFLGNVFGQALGRRSGSTAPGP